MKNETYLTNPDFLKPVFSKDYQFSLVIKNEIENVFQALTTEIPHWWSKNFSGKSNGIGESFTVRFGTTYKTFKVMELIPNKSVVWECTDTLIDLPELPNNTEWKGTKVVWDLYQQAEGTKIMWTHLGLTPQVVCYEICERGWQSFLQSLKAFVETGQGRPYEM